MRNNKGNLPRVIRALATQSIRLGSGVSALALLYNLIAHSVNSVAMAISPQAGPAGLHGAPVLQPLVELVITVPDAVFWPIVACLAAGFLAYLALEWVCNTQWVQEPVQVEQCWEEVRWYNPLSWVLALVCTVVEVLKWVLKQVCGWKEVVVIILVVICIIGVIAAVAAA